MRKRYRKWAVWLVGGGVCFAVTGGRIDNFVLLYDVKVTIMEGGGSGCCLLGSFCRSIFFVISDNCEPSRKSCFKNASKQSQRPSGRFPSSKTQS